MEEVCNGKEEQICAWCEGEAKLRCGGCNEKWYCSREHQRLHWDDHFNDCKTFKVKFSPEVGQYLVASRAMKPGTLFIRDESIVVGPLGTSNLLCLTCHAPIYHEQFLRCPECSWPMCSYECISAKEHDDECEVLSKDINLCGVPNRLGETPRYDLILILRCLLLKNTNPQKWKSIMSLASHGKELKEAREPYQMAAVRYLTEICKVDFDPDTVHHVRGVIIANVFEIRGPSGNKLRALYPNISLMNHSCAPNVLLGNTKEGIMEARAAVSVEKGEELCITYTGTDAPLWERQDCLRVNHFFNCRCKRCMDPLELGSNFSSARCPVCPQEIMTPTIKDSSINWTCSKCGTHSTLQEIKQEIEEWLFRLEMNDLFGSGTPFKISHALNMVEQQFHIKHFMWLKTAQAALHKMFYDASFSALKLKKEIWEKILDIFDLLEPGLSRRRGMSMIELANANIKMADKKFEKKGETSQHQMESFLREAVSLLSNAYTILKLNPQGTPERTVADSIHYRKSTIYQTLEEKNTSKK